MAQRRRKSNGPKKPPTMITLLLAPEVMEALGAWSVQESRHKRQHGAYVLTEAVKQWIDKTGWQSKLSHSPHTVESGESPAESKAPQNLEPPASAAPACSGDSDFPYTAG